MAKNYQFLEAYPQPQPEPTPPGDVGPGDSPPRPGDRGPETGGGDQQPDGGGQQPAGDQETEQSPDMPKQKPTGWGDDKPEHLPDQPEFMPGPAEWEVTEEQTVAGQLEKNLSKDSPLYKTIRDQVNVEASKKGLENSLMAMTAAEKMVVDTAFKVSKQDAATFARSAEFNATMENQFSAAEQAFMHNAMLSDQNFKQSQVLQKEQIAGKLAAIRAQTSGQLALGRQAQRNWEEQNEQLHAQNLEVIGTNHDLDLERLGFVQDLDIERMAFATEADMARAGWQADLNIAAQDRQFMHNMAINEQQFGQQARLNYQAQVAGLLQSEQQAIGMIGGSGASSEQMSQATRQLQDRTTANIDLIGSLFASQGGPATQAGVNGSPNTDYLYYGSSTGGGAPSPQPGGGSKGGGGNFDFGAYRGGGVGSGQPTGPSASAGPDSGGNMGSGGVSAQGFSMPGGPNAGMSGPSTVAGHFGEGVDMDLGWGTVGSVAGGIAGGPLGSLAGNYLGNRAAGSDSNFSGFWGLGESLWDRLSGMLPGENREKH